MTLLLQNVNFFFILPIFLGCGQDFIISYQNNKKKGKKKILRPPDWPQFRPPATQETNFFLRVASQKRVACIHVQHSNSYFVLYYFCYFYHSLWVDILLKIKLHKRGLLMNQVVGQKSITSTADTKALRLICPS